LYNLLGNAIKFTDQGEVTLHLTVEAANEEVAVTHLLIRVEDTGVGIPADQLDRIFDMFWQAEASHGRRFGGTGLGTTVARDLTQLMGGSIGVESQLDVGTTFSVRLPLLPDRSGSLDVKPPQLAGKRLLLFEDNTACLETYQEMAEGLGLETLAVAGLDDLRDLQAPRVDLVLLCDSFNGLPLQRILDRLDALLDPLTPVLFAGYRGRTAGLPARISRVILKPFIAEQLAEAAINLPVEPNLMIQERVSEPPEVVPSGIRILLAEDNAVASKVFQTLLLRKGHQVTAVKDGEEALRMARGESFHLAFIDLRMPRMDGLEFTRRYRSQEPAELRMPILALTANTAEDISAECREAGMDGFLNKPIEPERLDAILMQYVGMPDYVASPPA
jgi:two-component system sensor histidine kinase RpfC